MGYFLFNFTRRGASRGRSLRDQALELLNLGLWSIGENTAHRSTLAAGDEVLIYLGAPERSFLSRAVLATGVHDWTSDEAARYPGDFTGGVNLAEVEIFEKPLPMQKVLSQLGLSESNPQARFFGGVVRITEEDFQTILAAAREVGPKSEPVAVQQVGSEQSGFEVFLLTTERLRSHLRHGGGNLSEYDTRAAFIDRYLEALGYTEISDVQRGAVSASGDYPDYVLKVKGKARVAIEAKRLGQELGRKEAAQVVQYCSVLGVRWGAVTDGRYLKVYEAPLLDRPPHEREVFSVDLSDYDDREDFETRIWPTASLLAKAELETGAGLEQRAAQEAIREVLTTRDSATLRALRRELKAQRTLELRPGDLASLVSEMLG